MPVVVGVHSGHDRCASSKRPFDMAGTLTAMSEVAMPSPLSTAAPPGLIWSDALSLSMPVMDQTHIEFVDHLALVQAAEDAQLVMRWQALIEHTQTHFDQEDRWMQATGFAPGSCHITQHAVVLQVLREGLQAGHQGQLGTIRQMAHELTLWFPHHAQNMDAGLALHLKSVGYDPLTRQVSQPEALPENAVSRCGGPCSHPSPVENERST
jgi:hemerythrin-like metal-binding protein